MHKKIIFKKLQISMIKKYLRKDINLQKKGKKLLMIQGWNISIRMKYKKSQKLQRKFATEEFRNNYKWKQ